MVPQSRQDRNYIIADLLAFQQPIAVQFANVDSAVSEPQIGAAEFAVHSAPRPHRAEPGAGIFQTAEPRRGSIRPSVVAWSSRFRSEVPGGRGSLRRRWSRRGNPPGCQFDISHLSTAAPVNSRSVSLADPRNSSFKATSYSCMADPHSRSDGARRARV